MDEYSPDFYAASSGDYNADNLDCAVCADVLVDPCTLVCGHNFCELVDILMYQYTLTSVYVAGFVWLKFGKKNKVIMQVSVLKILSVHFAVGHGSDTPR